MCRVTTTTLDPEPQASAAARRFLQQTLTYWQLPSDVTDQALLLASELTTNAVLHAKTVSVLTVTLTGQYLEVGVGDLSAAQVPNAGRERLRGDQQPAETTDPLSEGGRGMLLIEALADSWGVQQLPGGKQVWFCLHVPRRTVPTQPCACDHESAREFFTGSGARVVNMLDH